MGTHPRLNLTDIAKAAGVSVSTVSRALRDNPRISQQVRDKIQKIAQDLGYRPNPHISALMTSMKRQEELPYKGTIAFLDLFDDPEKWKGTPLQVSFFSGCQSRCNELGYQLERLWGLEKGLSPRRLSSILEARGIQGVVFSMPIEHLLSFKKTSFNFSRFCIASIGLRIPGITIDFSRSDQFMSSQTAHIKSQEKGFKRIGFVYSEKIERDVNYRFLSGFQSVNLQNKEKGIPPHGFSGKSLNKNLFSKWLTKYKPEVVVSYWNTVYSVLIELGYRVPADISWVTLDWNENNSDCSGIDQNGKLVGSAAVDLVVSQINSYEMGIHKYCRGVVIEGTWKRGKTLIAKP